MNAVSLFSYLGSYTGCFDAGLWARRVAPRPAGIIAGQRGATFCKGLIQLGQQWMQSSISKETSLQAPNKTTTFTCPLLKKAI